MANTYQGHLLYIDLSSSEIRKLPLPSWLQEEYIGGKGFGARLLYDLLPEGAAALDPANVLMFFPGPLTGTKAPSMRACAVTKSPLTGLFLDSYFGGEFGQEIKFAGYDGLIISGRSESPVFLHITDDQVNISPAEKLWGQDALQANEELKSDLQDPTLKIVTIGQAGENLAPFALLSCEYNRQAGRGGAGAVMGSKNLKAIAIHGSRLVKVHNPQGFQSAVNQANQELNTSEDIKVLREAGTASAVEFSNETGLFPVKNFQGSYFEKAEQLGDKGQAKHLWLGNIACLGCPIYCGKVGVIRRGKYAGTVSDIVEYESAGLLGANLGISDIRAVTHLTRLCDRFGLDSMSAGGAIGFAMEAAERGIIEDPPGVQLRFGNEQAAEYLIRGMALQINPLGRLLSKGVRQAAREIGKGSEEFAQHTKGLETPAWGPRGALGTGLAYMTADRGGCHQRGLPAPIEIVHGEYAGQQVDPLSTKGKAAMVIDMQNFSAGTDTLVKCDFATAGIAPETFAAMLSAATGREVDTDFLQTLGARIWNLGRLFNLREGLDPATDRLPKRFLREALLEGPQKGQHFSPEQTRTMLKDYYALRGWDQTGHPLPETLDKYGLDQSRRFSISSSTGE